MLFHIIFNTMRLQSQIGTLTELASLLAEEGVIVEESLLSKWKNGHRTPRSRKIIKTLINIFIQRKTIQTLEQINIFLISANQHELTTSEREVYEEKLRPLISTTDRLYVAEKIVGKAFINSNKEAIYTLITKVRDTDQLIHILRTIEDDPERIHAYIYDSGNRTLKEKNNTMSDFLTLLSYTFHSPDSTTSAWRSRAYTPAPYVVYQG